MFDLEGDYNCEASYGGSSTKYRIMTLKTSYFWLKCNALILLTTAGSLLFVIAASCIAKCLYPRRYILEYNYLQLRSRLRCSARATGDRLPLLGAADTPEDDLDTRPYVYFLFNNSREASCALAKELGEQVRARCGIAPLYHGDNWLPQPAEAQLHSRCREGSSALRRAAQL